MSRCLKCRKRIEEGNLWCEKHREVLDIFEKIKIFKVKKFLKSNMVMRLEEGISEK